MNEDRLHYANETDHPSPGGGPIWSVLIVDDEAEVHSVTTLALEGFRFCGRALRFLHAYSGAEARRLLDQTPDIALVLLDVVMETDQAGLDVVEYLRNVLKNRFVRIVLRTGQPGQAPELEVITHYDINDYKHKTELTRDRLHTTVHTALSTYRDLIALDANRRGLEKVIDATAHLFELDSIDQFAQGVLEQLIALLFLQKDALMLHAASLAATGSNDDLKIIAATGDYTPLIGQPASEALPGQVLERIRAARQDGRTVFGNNFFIRRESGDPFGEWIFYVASSDALGEPDRVLIELFCRNIALARRHILLKQASTHAD